MANFFNHFPATFYKKDDTAELQAVTNITSRVNILDDIRFNSNYYDEYSINDGDTPEILAHKFYKDPEKHWVVLMMNDIVDPQYDWPLKEQTLMIYINDKYTANANNTMTGLRWAQNNTHSYYKIVTKTLTNGTKSVETVEIDKDTYDSVIPTATLYTLSNGDRVNVDITRQAKSYYEYEIDTNDNKRLIKILRQEFMPLVNQELRNVFS